MRRQPKAQTLAALAGNRGFESTSLQRGVYCEPDFRGRIPSMTVRDRRPGSATGLYCAPRAAPEEELVRLRQAALRRARGGARLSRPLYPPRRDRKQPAGQPRRARCDVPLQGLPQQWPGAVSNDDAQAERVHRTLPAACSAKGVHRIRHYGLLGLWLGRAAYPGCSVDPTIKWIRSSRASATTMRSTSSRRCR